MRKSIKVTRKISSGKSEGNKQGRDWGTWFEGFGAGYVLALILCSTGHDE